MNQKNLFQHKHTISNLVPCVFCYVPGSGANKLKKILSGNFNLSSLRHETDASTSFVMPNNMVSTFDNQWLCNNQKSKSNKLFDDAPEYNLYPQISEIDHLPIIDYNSKKIFVTHTMSSKILKHQFPGRTVIKIFGDIMLSLRRWYVVYGQYQHYPNPCVNDCWKSCLEIFQNNQVQLYIAHQILFQLEYYQTHWDFDCDYFVDISLNDCYFSKYMTDEYQKCQNKDFDNVADILCQHPKVQSILKFLNNCTPTY